MELGSFAQACAHAYREIGEAHGWRKGRNSPRGYDALTIPHETWDDGPHHRFLSALDHHLATAAMHLDACAVCLQAENSPAAVTLARVVFVESSKASWLLDDEVNWTQRAARAHLELFANLDERMRVLPKHLESGYPNFRRRQWKESRDLMRDNVIDALFGKRGLKGKRDDLTLVGEPLLTSRSLESDFAARLGEQSDYVAGPCVAAPELFLDPAFEPAASDGAPVVVHPDVGALAVSIALTAWLRSLEQWVEYHAWDKGPVVKLGLQFAGLPGASTR
jgi:hypothetical protein